MTTPRIDPVTDSVQFWLTGRRTADTDREVCRAVCEAIARDGRAVTLYAIEDRCGRLATVRLMEIGL